MKIKIQYILTPIILIFLNSSEAKEILFFGSKIYSFDEGNVVVTSLLNDSKDPKLFCSNNSGVFMWVDITPEGVLWKKATLDESPNPVVSDVTNVMPNLEKEKNGMLKGENISIDFDNFEQSLSPNSRHLVIRSSNIVYLVDTLDGTVKRSQLPTVQAFNFLWSPSSEMLTFLMLEKNHYQLYLIDTQSFTPVKIGGETLKPYAALPNPKYPKFIHTWVNSTTLARIDRTSPEERSPSASLISIEGDRTPLAQVTGLSSIKKIRKQSGDDRITIFEDSGIYEARIKDDGSWELTLNNENFANELYLRSPSKRLAFVLEDNQFKIVNSKNEQSYEYMINEKRSDSTIHWYRK